MKKKAIAALIAALMVLQVGQVAFAVPGDNLTPEQRQQMEAEQNQYADAEAKLNSLEGQLQELQGQAQKIDENIKSKNNDIAALESKIDKLHDDMKVLSKELEEKQEVYGKRMRAVYKNGTPGYIDVILNSTSFSDLLSNVQAVSKIMDIDKKMMDEVKDKQNEIEKTQSAINDDISNIQDLKVGLEKELAELSTKKDAQKVLVEQAREVKKTISVNLADKERLMIKDLAAMVNDSNSSKATLMAARDALREIRKQVKVIDSEVVDLIEKSKSKIAAIEEAEKKKQQSLDRGDGGNIQLSGSAQQKASQIVAYALSLQGKPYVYGATGPNSFDCSGFTQYVYRKHGISLSRTTFTQVNEGRAVSVGNAQPGDLVFFGSSSSPHHVGIYIGNGNYVHAPQTGDVVKVSSLSSRRDGITVRRILQ